MSENPSRIEPARLEEFPSSVGDLVAEIASKSSALGSSLHPRTSANLAELVRVMNTYYSNLIEGHNTRPVDIQRALAGEFAEDSERRNLQIEAAAHVRVQAKIDRLMDEDLLPEPASRKFILWLHQEFYRDASEKTLLIQGTGSSFVMKPGAWRVGSAQNVAVGRHLPPSSDCVEDFMVYFEKRFRFEGMGMSARILSLAAAHHRLNYIHPFPDGNGRVSRLMSHAMALKAGIGAHSLWSISRGLARGLKSRKEYKQMMDEADTPREGDLDGRGNLSQRALAKYTEWFLSVCIDQIEFMTNMFNLETLNERLQRYVELTSKLKPETTHLLQEALFRGEFQRGDVPRITKLPERSARRVLSDAISHGLLASDTPKGNMYLRFPASSLDILFPKLYSEL